MADKPIPVPSGWEEDYRLAFEARYLGRQHLRGKEATLTISRVLLPELKMVKPGQRPEVKRKLVIEFDALKRRNDGTPYEWIVCKTNADVIAMLHGNAPLRDWTGKQITLYDDPTVEAFGKVVGAIRVRPRRPDGGSSRSGGRQQPARDAPSPPAGSGPAAGPPSQEEIDEIVQREREEREP